MATYTVKILNNAGFDKSHAVFMSPPVVTSNASATPVYANAWATSPNVTDSGWAPAVQTPTTYVYEAQAPQPSQGAMPESGGTEPVNVVTPDTGAFANSGATGFIPVTSPGGPQTGAFAIVTGGDFTPVNGFKLDLASDSGTPIPSPVATFDGLPNEVYNITPVVKFYVADGLYEAGAAIDYSAASANSAAIDFAGGPQTTATVIQASNGAFSVVYS